MEAEIGLMSPQTKDGWQPPQSGMGQVFPRATRETPCRRIDVRCVASRTGREYISAAVTPLVCGHVTAALGNENRL